MIILEGPDDARKSTISKILETTLNIPVYNIFPGTLYARSKPTDKDFWMYIFDHFRVIKLLKKLNANVIIDRHPLITEHVYSTLANRNTVFKYTNFDIDENDIVFLLDNFNAINEEVPGAFAQYTLTLKKNNVKFHIINTNNLSTAVHKIIEIINERNKQ